MKAHKLILAAVSPVFRRMFFANNENNFTTETEAIDITDSECFAFQKMINFIYSKVIYKNIFIKILEIFLYRIILYCFMETSRTVSRL